MGKDEIESQEGLTEIGQELRKCIIFNLIITEKLDFEKCSDKNYINTIIRENIPTDVGYIITKSETMIESAKSLVKSDNWSALILACAAIEYELNQYYVQFLGLHDFSDKEIKEIIKRNNFQDKIGWLMKLTTGQELPDHIIEQILKYVELRNRIVHYKATPGSLRDLIEKNEENTEACEIDKLLEEKIDFGQLFLVIDELHISLESIFEEMSPEYKKAKEIALS